MTALPQTTDAGSGSYVNAFKRKAQYDTGVHNLPFSSPRSAQSSASVYAAKVDVAMDPVQSMKLRLQRERKIRIENTKRRKRKEQAEREAKAKEEEERRNVLEKRKHDLALVTQSIRTQLRKPRLPKSSSDSSKPESPFRLTHPKGQDTNLVLNDSKGRKLVARTNHETTVEKHGWNSLLTDETSRRLHQGISSSQQQNRTGFDTPHSMFKESAENMNAAHHLLSSIRHQLETTELDQLQFEDEESSQMSEPYPTDQSNRETSSVKEFNNIQQSSPVARVSHQGSSMPGAHGGQAVVSDSCRETDTFCEAHEHKGPILNTYGECSSNDHCRDMNNSSRVQHVEYLPNSTGSTLKSKHGRGVEVQYGKELEQQHAGSNNEVQGYPEQQDDEWHLEPELNGYSRNAHTSPTQVVQGLTQDTYSPRDKTDEATKTLDEKGPEGYSNWEPSENRDSVSRYSGSLSDQQKKEEVMTNEKVQFSRNHLGGGVAWEVEVGGTPDDLCDSDTESKSVDSLSPPKHPVQPQVPNTQPHRPAAQSDREFFSTAIPTHDKMPKKVFPNRTRNRSRQGRVVTKHSQNSNKKESHRKPRWGGGGETKQHRARREAFERRKEFASHLRKKKKPRSPEIQNNENTGMTANRVDRAKPKSRSLRLKEILTDVKNVSPEVLRLEEEESRLEESLARLDVKLEQRKLPPNCPSVEKTQKNVVGNRSNDLDVPNRKPVSVNSEVSMRKSRGIHPNQEPFSMKWEEVANFGNPMTETFAHPKHNYTAPGSINTSCLAKPTQFNREHSNTHAHSKDIATSNHAQQTAAVHIPQGSSAQTFENRSHFPLDHQYSNNFQNDGARTGAFHPTTSASDFRGHGPPHLPREGNVNVQQTTLRRRSFQPTPPLLEQKPVLPRPRHDYQRPEPSFEPNSALDKRYYSPRTNQRSGLGPLSALDTRYYSPRTNQRGGQEYRDDWGHRNGGKAETPVDVRLAARLAVAHPMDAVHQSLRHFQTNGGVTGEGRNNAALHDTRASSSATVVPSSCSSVIHPWNKSGTVSESGRCFGVSNLSALPPLQLPGNSAKVATGAQSARAPPLRKHSKPRSRNNLGMAPTRNSVRRKNSKDKGHIRTTGALHLLLGSPP